ncbi:MAG: hypothetical protein H0V71_11065 [Chloroflexi bacterium]|nr:hypothetical protein [Chloroflexota bacterium]
MTMLNVVMTHLRAPAVRDSLRYLQDIAPEARFAICHVGEPADFSELEYADKVLVDDPSFRLPPRTFQSFHETFAALYDRFVKADPTIDSLYLFEYDHMILDGRFEERIKTLAVETDADLLGKTCSERTGTNWIHYVRFRRDERLVAHLRAISVHEDPARMYGCLGNGFWLKRAALEAYLSVDEHPPCYGELYLPTLLHHLGFRVVDVDAHSTLYRHVRADGEFTLSELVRLKHEGHTFVHPYKGPSGIPALRRITESA